MSRFYPFAVIASSVVLSALPGCADDEEGAPPDGTLILRGEYSTSDGSAEVRSLSFESPTDYRLRRKGCDDAACEEHGKYTFDRAGRRLDLSVDGGRPYSLPFEVTSTEREEPAPAPAALTTKTLVEKPSGDESLVGKSDLMQVLVATGVRLLEVKYEGGKRQRHRHLFLLRGKLYIAPITQATLGSFPEKEWNSEQANARLHNFAWLTNKTYSEDPPDGSESSAQYKIWASIALDVSCNGSQVSMTLTDPETKAGWEPPSYYGIVDPLKTDYTTDGAYAMQASGKPNEDVEPTFQFVHSRMNKKIWFKVGGRVSCNPYGDATLNYSELRLSSFPSFKLFLRKFTDGADVANLLLDQRQQGDFVRLWYLETVPDF